MVTVVAESISVFAGRYQQNINAEKYYARVLYERDECYA